ncbi:MAG: hypothetical protein LBM02_10140 [Lachnospiraceae bacterium]|jgi:hypothetical protein|nr:hypothetical protein [Lachnospiraceae bacterium]
MAQACELHITAEGKLKAKTYPKLMDSVLDYVNDNIEEAKSLYGLTISDEFKNYIGNNKPTLTDLLEYVDVYNSFENEKLTPVDLKFMTDITLSDTERDNILDNYVSSFTVDGTFGLDKTSLEKGGLFTDSEILQILNTSESDIDKIQSIYYKIQNSDISFDNVITPYVISQENTIGKYNPDVYRKTIYDNYIGLETKEDVLNKAAEIQDAVLLNNPVLVESILSDIQDKQQLVQYDVSISSDGNLEFDSRKVNNNIVSLQQTLDVNQNFDDVLFRINSILEDLDRGELKDIETLEDLFAEKGINIKGFNNITTYRTSEEISDYLTSLHNLIYDIQNAKGDIETLKESLEEYDKHYKDFFGDDFVLEKKTIYKLENEGVYMNIETSIPEHLLFSAKSVIRYEDNIYRKIRDNKSLADLYEMIYATNGLLPKSVFSVEVKDDNKRIAMEYIDRYVSDKSKSLLTYKSVDSEVLKKIIAYKILTGATLERDVNDIDESYLRNEYIDPDKFLIDFNKKILKSDELSDLFYYSERGLEAKVGIGDYTKILLQSLLTEQEYSDLQQYSLISGNESLSSLTPEYEPIVTADRNVLRNYYANNMNVLDELNNPYSIVGYTTAIVDNIIEPFVKIKGELYEQLEPNIYELVDIVEDRYKNYTLQQPKLSLSESEIKNHINDDEVDNSDVKVEVKKGRVENEENIEFC